MTVDVVLLAARGDLSGASRWTATTARALACLGLKVAVLYWYEGGTVADELAAAGTDVQVLGARSSRDVVAIVGLRAALRRWDPCAVHLVDQSIGVVVGALGAKARTTLSCHTFPRTRKARFRLSAASWGAAVCLVPSAGLQSWLDSMHPRLGCPTMVIPNIVTEPHFVRCRAGLGRVRLAVLSRIVWNKGFDLLVALGEVLAARGSPVVIDVFGSGRDLSAVRSAVAASRGVELFTFRGPVPGPHRAYFAADGYLNVSAEETFGLAAAEAQAYGLPVVGVVRDSVLHGTLGDDSVYLVDRLGPDEVADAIDRFVSAVGEEVSGLGRVPHQRFTARYTAEVVAPRLSRLLLGGGENCR